MAMNKQELVQQNKDKVNSVGFSSFMNAASVKNKINDVIGSDKGQRFITGVISAVNSNQQLSKCTNTSIFSGALLGESLNLSPSPQLGHYFLVPFDKKEKIGGKWVVVESNAQFQLGYKGYLQLAIRSGQYKDIDVIEIREGEYLGRDKETGKQRFQFIEDDDKRESLPIVGYLAYFEYLNGFSKQIYWTKEKMQKHAKEYSQSYLSDIKNKTSYSFWTKDFDNMAFKTLIRQLISKWGIMSIEMQTAMESDMAVITDNGKEYVDNKPEENNEPELERKEVNINEL